MPKLIAFENTTLDGYFAGANGDLSWAYDGVKGKLNLELTKTRAFPKGNVLLCYAPRR